MATAAENQAKFQEIANRGIQDRLPPEIRPRFDEAVKRGLITMPQQEQPAQPEQAVPQEPQTAVQRFGDAATDIATDAATGIGRGVESVIGEDALNVAGEFAATANRSLTEFVDMLGPDLVNNILTVAGSETRVPTLTGALESTGIQGEFMEPGIARDFVQAGGALTTAAGGLKQVPRAAEKVASIAADFLGAGSTVATAPVRAVAPLVQEAQQATGRQLAKVRQAGTDIVSSARKDAELPLKRGATDVSTFGFKIDPKTGESVRSAVDHDVAKQGFDPDTVSMVKAFPKASKRAVKEMLHVIERGFGNKQFRELNHPRKILGQGLADRIDTIRASNRQAGKEINEAANALKGQSVDFSPAVDEMISSFDDLGVKIVDGVPNFEGSDVEGLKGIETSIKRLMNRMRDTKSPDAHDVHRLKKFIDETVAYGKSPKGGLTGTTERVLKELRHNLDGVLDGQFPVYDAANTKYADTIQALNNMQDMAGKKVDLLGPNRDKALGRLSRRILSNAQSAEQVLDVITEADTIAKKYSPRGLKIVPRGTDLGPSIDFDDNLEGLAIFSKELEKVFDIVPPGSFKGEIIQGAGKAAREGGLTGVAIDTAISAADKARGVNKENALKALRALVND